MAARLGVDGEVEQVLGVAQREAGRRGVVGLVVAVGQPQLGAAQAAVLQLEQRLLVERGGAVVRGGGPGDPAYVGRGNRARPPSRTPRP